MNFASSDTKSNIRSDELNLASSEDIRRSRSGVFFSRLLVVATFLFEPLTNTFISLVRQSISLPFHLDTVFCYVCLLYILLRALPYLIEAFPWEEIVPFFVIVAYGLIRYILNDYGGSPSYYGEILSDFLLASLPMYALYRIIGCDTKLTTYLYAAAIVGAILQVFRVFFLSTYTDTSYSQYLGYQTLPFFLLCTSTLFRSGSIGRRFAYCCFSLVCFYTIMCTGARGPIVAALSFFVIRLAIFNGGGSIRKIVLTLAVAVAAIVLYLNIEQVVSGVVSFVSLGGGSSRLEAKLEWGTLFSKGGRDDIADFCYNSISESPLLGYGIGQDRILINTYMNGNNVAGYYPHNIFLELAMHYGIILASTLVVLCGYGLVRAFCSGNAETRDLILVLAFTGLVPLFFSSTYLDSPFLFALIGLCVSVLKPCGNKIRMRQS